ncbi:MAG: ABC transporter permease [Ardenticatenaceae bacterium]|nr:ABC transporter permease [Ardenticatenaceae bacterium]MCB9444624.1 ABC transporter permease [Ardenticatenaceae bacterium]
MVDNTSPIHPTSDSRLNTEQTFQDRLAYFGRFLWRDRGGVIGLVIFLIVVGAAVFAPVITSQSPFDQDLRASKLPPAWQEEGDWAHPFGTDSLGKDIYSRVIYGARVSLMVGLFGVLIASALGLVIGAIAGYAGGRLDAAIMGGINLILSLPYLLFVVFIAAILGRSLINVILIFGITDAPIFARVTRGEVLRIRQSGYVESAISAGARWPRIIFDHIIPNLIGPLITLATFEMSAMIFYEAGLGFLGLSVPPNEYPTWGNMLSAGRKYMTSYPWMASFPGLAIMFTSLGMNLLGDWLRDVLDPRLRRARK